MATATTTFTLDPAALAAYSSTAREVSQRLATAATTAAGALGPENQYGSEFGTVGAAFAAQFAAAVLQHCQQLCDTGKLVDACGCALAAHGEAMGTTDSDMAAALSRIDAVDVDGDPHAAEVRLAGVAEVLR